MRPENCGRSNEDLECLGCGAKLGVIFAIRRSGDPDYCVADVSPKPCDESKESDPINPSHYKAHPSGIECIRITEHMNFCLGNAIKYIWRADEKGQGIEDLKKAVWYLEREIKRRQDEPKIKQN